MKFKKFIFKKVKSTNSTALRIIKNYNYESGIITAEFQKNGRGQYGRKWISYKGNLFVSFFYNLENLNLTIKKITKINCLLVKKFISQFYKKKISIKKPNDLLINNKKIAGILQETTTKLNKKYLIVGIGINVNKSPDIKGYPTTNLFELLDKKLNPKVLENQLKLTFEKNLSKFYKMNNS